MLLSEGLPNRILHYTKVRLFAQFVSISYKKVANTERLGNTPQRYKQKRPHSQKSGNVAFYQLHGAYAQQLFKYFFDDVLIHHGIVLISRADEADVLVAIHHTEREDAIAGI